jgi:transcription elongation factor Elf1
MATKVEDVFQCDRCQKLEYWSEVVVSEVNHEGYLCRDCGKFPGGVPAPVCVRDGVDMQRVINSTYQVDSLIGKWRCPVCTAETIMGVRQVELLQKRVRPAVDAPDAYPCLPDGKLDGVTILRRACRHFQEDEAPDWREGEQAAYNQLFRKWFELSCIADGEEVCDIATWDELAGAEAHLNEVMNAD